LKKINKKLLKKNFFTISHRTGALRLVIAQVRYDRNITFVSTFSKLRHFSLQHFDLKKMITLYPHQKEAVEWMKATERRPRIVPTQPHGGILAHAMGLGKTMTMLSFIRDQAHGRTLVVCPKSLLTQWNVEAHNVGWNEPHTVTIYHGNSRKIPERTGTSHQLVLTTFDIVRLEMTRGRQLHDTNWDRVVLDEAHRICEQTSKTSHAIQALRAPNRWCITGTPFKNEISDLMALSRFLMVAPYCNMIWWKWYGNSVTKLREWRRLTLHLRDKSVLSLPPMQKHFLTATHRPSESVLDTMLKNAHWKIRVGEVGDDEVGSSSSLTLNHDQHELLRILRMRQASNHPLLLAPPTAMRHQMKNMKPHEDNTTCDSCGEKNDHIFEACTMKTHRLCGKCREEPVCTSCIADLLREARGEGEGEWIHSAKTRALWTYLKDVVKIKTSDTKVVLFSQWTTCLDLLGWMLEHEDVGYARYDGRVNMMEEREQVITHFRNTPKCQVLLTSLGAGGEGVNLTFASHVIIMEPYWNVATEQQAIDRIHRIGQKETTHVARMHLEDSVETWVREIQTRKSNELQRLLYEKIMVNEIDSDHPPTPTLSTITSSGGGGGIKRSFVSKLRPQFEHGSNLEKEKAGGCLGAFLMRPPKQIKLKA
jgi:SNF2 family DNA or RNA helicase